MFQRQATFQDAVKNALTTNYCNFSGRASRSDYWWFTLFTVIVSWVLSIIGICISSSVMTTLSSLWGLVILLPSLGLCVRRLHDIGKSGWWILIGLIPVAGAIVLLIWYCQNSQMHDNEYGPVPHLEY